MTNEIEKEQAHGAIASHQSPVEDAAIVRKKIVGAALAEIDAVGLSRTTMKNVASRAEISISLISYYFGSKNQLIQACSKQWLKTFSGLSQRLLTILAEASSNEELLSRALWETVSTGRRHQLEVRLMLREAALTIDGGVPVSEATDVLDAIQKAIAARLQVSEARVRAIFHQASMLIVRSCLLSKEELTRMYGGEGHVPWERCVAHLETTLLAACSLDLRDTEKSSSKAKA